MRILFLAVAGLFAALILPSARWSDATPLVDVLADLGDSAALDRRAELPGSDSALVRRGYDIVHRGFTVREGGDTSQPVSRFFLCTDCHNTVIEDPDLRFSDPEARLDYVAERNIPLLQGTTLKGVINRETWYNGDYGEKYGAAALEAHDNLEKAVQLCARECSQGRTLEEWELQSVLAYLGSLGYTLGDLGLRDDTRSRLRRAQESDNEEERKAALAELRSYYRKDSPATFRPPPADVAAGYDVEGNAERGEPVYRLSCMHCHKPGGTARFELAQDSLSFRRLAAKIGRTRGSGFYPAIRHGLSATERRLKYMPLYPAERLSDRQIEDLRAYVEAHAGRAGNPD